MSLTLYLLDTENPDMELSFNVTHNLTEMAQEAELYDCLWRAEKNGFVKAGQLVEPIKRGLKSLGAMPEQFKKYNQPNGWGSYDVFVSWLKRVLEACEENPDCLIETCV